ncbi:MAG: beta-ketoacyl synthase N-terminal-like domain-containing protein, partial [Sulfurovaceae bacterium]
MQDIYIEDFSYILTDQKIPTGEIKKELEIKSGQKYRRINRYIILALAGIYNMPSIKEIDEKCALLIGTRNGCITETINMLDQIHNSSLLPMPFTFIASSTNMVNFHVAQSLGLNGSNFTLSNRYSPFAVALDSAYFDINDSKTSAALVGCVDEIAEPIEKFKERVNLGTQEIREG